MERGRRWYPLLSINIENNEARTIFKGDNLDWCMSGKFGIISQNSNDVEISYASIIKYRDKIYVEFCELGRYTRKL